MKMKINLQWWYHLALPSAQKVPQTSPKQRQKVRYARFTAVSVLIMVILNALSLPLVLNPTQPDREIIYVILLACACIIAALAALKIGWQYLAAGLVVLSSMIASVGSFFTNVLDPALVPSLLILVIPIVLSGAMMPPISSLVVGIVSSLIVVIITFTQPRTAYYEQVVAIGYYAVTLYVPIFILLTVAIMNYLITRSLIETIYRADQAEELIRLQEEITSYQVEQEKTRQKLSQEVALIAHIHAEVANGKLFARVPLDQLGRQSSLWAIGVPLNNLLNRMERLKQDTERLENMQNLIRQIIADLQNARLQHSIPQITTTNDQDINTLLAEVYHIVDQRHSPFIQKQKQ